MKFQGEAEWSLTFILKLKHMYFILAVVHVDVQNTVDSRYLDLAYLE